MTTNDNAKRALREARVIAENTAKRPSGLWRAASFDQACEAAAKRMRETRPQGSPAAFRGRQ